MSGFRLFFSCTGFLALLGAYTGCVPSKPQTASRSFVPPKPRAAAPALVTPEPPPLAPSIDLHTSLRDVPGPQFANQADAVIREADWHYELGRKHYKEGDDTAARREFDRAIDVLLSAPEEVRGLIDAKLDEMVEAVHHLDLAGLGSADLGEPQFEKPPLEDLPPLTFPVDPKLKNRVLEEVRATVSQLPLQVNDEVLSYIHYFSSERGRKVLLAGFRRAGRYRPMILRVLHEEGVPPELIYLAQAESGFLPRAVSRARATGMWQFMQFRGAQYGLLQTSYTDDRLDPEKATRAAARHLRDLFQHYGDWYLAIAAYNCGPAVVDRAVERTGYADFWELRRRGVLPRETSNYVPIILAMTIMAKNPSEYGLNDVDPDPSLDYNTIDLSAPTNLLLLADLADCPVSQLRDLNPALLKNVAPQGWRLHVPKSAPASMAEVLDTIPADRRCCWRVHRVGEGETLAAIARRYKVTEKSIASVNHDMGHTLESGSLLVIPAAPQPEERRRPPGKRTAGRRKSGGASYKVAKLPPRKSAAVKR
jgi:membrane-bound lytic murein transglycosylase D